jgi:hypothetical protein
MSRMRLLIVSGRTLNKAAMTVWGQGVAVVQEGSQNPVGEGEDGSAAGAGSGQPWTVTASLVQVRFPLAGMQRHQCGDQGVPLWCGKSGQGGMVQPGRGWADQTEPDRY